MSRSRMRNEEVEHFFSDQSAIVLSVPPNEVVEPRQYKKSSLQIRFDVLVKQVFLETEALVAASASWA